MVRSELVKLFIRKAIASGAEVDRFSTEREAADFVVAFLKEKGIERIIAAQDSQLLFKDKKGVSFFEARASEDFLQAEAGLVMADYGVAETGTLVRLDENDKEKMTWTLPPLCLCLLGTERIVPSLEDISEVFSKHLSQIEIPSPQVSLVTGPSRTADIENELSIGVHGPSCLKILVVEGKTK